MSLKELAIQLNTSIRIVKEDVNMLTHHQVNKYARISVNDHGVYADLHDNVGPDTLVEFILNEAIIFDIIEYLFLEDQATLEELANEFHISTTTIYRELKKLEKFLNKFNLCISTKPIRITGDENIIRNFYLQYFAEKYSILDWPFKNLDEQRFEELLTSIIKSTGHPLELSILYNVKMSAAISLQRFKHGYRAVNKSAELNDIIKDLYNLTHKSHNYNYILGTTLNKELLNEMFYKYITKKFFFSYEQFLKAATVDKEITLSYMQLTYILDTLCQKYNLSLPNKEDLIYRLYTTAVLDAQEINTFYLIYDRNQSIHNYVSTYHSSFYEESKEFLEEYLRMFHNSDSAVTLNHLMYTMFSHWRLLLVEINSVVAVSKAVIISDKDDYHGYMLKDILDTYLANNQLEITVGHLPSLSIEALEKLDCDFIITNFTLPELKTKRCIYIDNFPSYHDINKIRNSAAETIRLQKP